MQSNDVRLNFLPDVDYVICRVTSSRVTSRGRLTVWTSDWRAPQPSLKFAPYALYRPDLKHSTFRYHSGLLIQKDRPAGRDQAKLTMDDAKLHQEPTTYGIIKASDLPFTNLYGTLMEDMEAALKKSKQLVGEKE